MAFDKPWFWRFGWSSTNFLLLSWWTEPYLKWLNWMQHEKTWLNTNLSYEPSHIRLRANRDLSLGRHQMVFHISASMVRGYFLLLQHLILLGEVSRAWYLLLFRRIEGNIRWFMQGSKTSTLGVILCSMLMLDESYFWISVEAIIWIPCLFLWWTGPRHQ